MFYLRGKIITSYAQVEFLLADLSVKLNVRFPFKIKDRIRAAKEVAERPGYGKYKDEPHEICDRLAPIAAPAARTGMPARFDFLLPPLPD